MKKGRMCRSNSNKCFSPKIVSKINRFQSKLHV